MQPEFHYLIHLAMAFVLSMAIGIEREINQKSAGLRTHMLVGVGSALFMIISKYGFNDISGEPGYSLDGSRIAAQVVSGIGFLGAGLIFVRRDLVRGLTTAASVWLVAAVGMAAGSGMFVIAPAAVLLYLFIVAGVPPLSKRLPKARSAAHSVKIRYVDGRGILREIIKAVADHGLAVNNLSMKADLFGETILDEKSQDIILRLTGSPKAMEAAVVTIDQIDGVAKISYGEV